MKKILYLFTASLFVLSSCSSDIDDSLPELPSEDISILPKTISYEYPSDFLGTNSKSVITYDGNKIRSIVDESSKAIYTYEGNIITKYEQFSFEALGKEVKRIEVLYEYEAGKLKTRIFKDGISENGPNGSITKTIYTHNQDSTISYIVYDVVSITKEKKKEGVGKLTYKDGNLIKSEHNNITNSLFDGVSVYEYDTKMNPLKNVLGYGLLLDEVEGFGKNNIIKTTRMTKGDTKDSVLITSYIYNDNVYPKRHTSLDGRGESIEYEIEYTY